MFHSDKDLQCRNIITKAVCGKGRKFSNATHTITLPNKPSNILGSWAINHSFEAEKVGDVIEVIGTYDLDLWYSYANNTKTAVATETISYAEQIPLSYLDHNCVKTNLVINATAEGPTCTDAKISSGGNSVIVEVEKEYVVEVIGETKVCVVICNDSCDDDEKGFLLEEEDIDSSDTEDLDPSFIIDDLE